MNSIDLKMGFIVRPIRSVMWKKIKLLNERAEMFCCDVNLEYIMFRFVLTGLPLISPDVCPPPVPSQSSRSLLPCPTQQPQPQAPPQAALLPTPQQHPMGNHMMAQVCASSICISAIYSINTSIKLKRSKRFWWI